ncbi:transmembrane transport protein [Dactylosporangium siamense]|uniref:Transporter n=1 Tax=Dactylosporangium siamense TaxID=685454 RepID=A0A919PNR2_9ACTN|nr:transmembrane transport protein [Dactylosporangium siamense]GIG45513.1 transporter [Dactylosporangium siamense]
MIWLTWRQFRGQFLATVGLLAVLVAYLLYLGVTIRDAYDSDIVGCVAARGCLIDDATASFIRDYRGPVTIPSIVLMILPALIGVFWGAPLITRELETNTHRLVWNQSVTRTYWLAIKLGFIGLVSLVLTGTLSVLLTWAASRYDLVGGNRFDQMSFASRNIAPLGYIVFAVVLGTLLGMVTRRTVPAMAVTLLIIGVVQVLAPTLVRPYLRAPVTVSVAYNAETRARGGSLDIPSSNPLSITGYSIPGALTLTDRTSLRNAGGTEVRATDVKDCLADEGVTSTDGWQQVERCIAAKNLHFDLEAQPANRYWSFQWIEFGAFVGLGLLLSGLAFWRIRHVRG